MKSGLTDYFGAIARESGIFAAIYVRILMGEHLRSNTSLTYAVGSGSRTGHDGHRDVTKEKRMLCNGTGILAIWHDIEPSGYADFLE